MDRKQDNIALYLCTRHVEKPYYIKEINKNIYSIEELSYYIYNYLYLIEDKFFNEALIEYVDDVLKHKTIAAGLRQLVTNNGSLGEKIAFVIKNSGYYSEKEAERLENHLAMLNSKTAAERIKAKADILMDTGKYNMAITYYNSIINKALNNELPERFYGDVYNNLGVAYARLFEYEQAAVEFRCAYRMNSAAESLESVFMCDLLSNNEKRLKIDKEKYGVSDTVINRIKAELEKKRLEIQDTWRIDREKDFIRKCRKEYVVETNS